MAKAQVDHSEDAVTITFNGDVRRPEPAMGAIKFPGGLVEVARASDGSYWAHVRVDDPRNIVSSRIDYDRTGWLEQGIPPIPMADRVQHLAVRVANLGPTS